MGCEIVIVNIVMLMTMSFIQMNKMRRSLEVGMSSWILPDASERAERASVAPQSFYGSLFFGWHTRCAMSMQFLACSNNIYAIRTADILKCFQAFQPAFSLASFTLLAAVASSARPRISK